MYTFLIIFIVIIIIGIYLIFKFSKTKYKITTNKLIFLNKQLKRIVVNGSYKEQIIDMDKLYHKILLEGGYNGTFGEILKSKPSEISDLNKIWELHKLRNKLVHDFDILSVQILKNNSNNYKNEIKRLFNQFK